MKLKADTFATDCPDRVLEPKREPMKNKSKTLCQQEWCAIPPTTTIVDVLQLAKTQLENNQ
jgi:hypothetical protein